MKWMTFKSLLPMYTIVACILILGAIGGSKAVTSFKESVPIRQKITVIIDAGHGGEDGGATSCTGVLESNINLEIALRLNDLMHLLGIRTKMIRTTDISVYTSGGSLSAKKVSDLRQRVKMVNEEGSALLISLHQNYFSDERYSGAQVFYAPTPGSEGYASSLQSAFVQTLNKGSNRQCKKADGIYLMQHINTPGVLIECGFISNHAEEANLRDPDYQKKLCCVIAAITSTNICQSVSA